MKQYSIITILIFLVFINISSSYPQQKTTKGFDIYDLKKASIIADSLIRNKPREAELYIPACINEAKIQNNKFYRMHFYYTLATVWYENRKMEKTKTYCDSALALASSLNNKKYMGLIYIYEGLILIKKIDLEKGMKCFFDALHIGEEIKDISLIVDARNYIGIFNYVLHNYDDALKYEFSALKLAEEYNYAKGISLSCEHICIIYNRIKEFSKAEEYGFRALKIVREINNKPMESGILETLTVLYKNMQNLVKAGRLYEEILKLHKEMGVDVYVGFTLCNIGDTYFKLKQYDKADKKFKQAIDIFEETKDLRGLLTATNLEYLNCLKMNNPVEALHFLELNKKYGDSLYAINVSAKTKELQAKYEFEKKDKEISLLQKDKEVAANKFKFLLVFSLMLVLIALLTVYAYMSKHRSHNELQRKNIEIEEQNKKLEELNNILVEVNKEKDRFSSIIAHDLKSPFHGLLGISQLLYTEPEKFSKSELHDISEKLFFTTKQLYELLENLLYWGRLNSERIQLFKTNVSVEEEVKSVKLLYRELAAGKKIEFDVLIPEGTIIYADKDTIQLVLRNLVSNAIKFSTIGGEIKISAEIKKDTISVSVADKGIGMDQNQINTLFSNDTQSTSGTDNEKGTALGLIICKELIERNGGVITVKSALGNGATFTFELPTQIKSQN